MKKIISIIIIIVLSLNMCISAFGDEPMTVVTVVSGGGGDINYVNKDEKGNEYYLAVADDGYDFIGWEVDGNPITDVSRNPIDITYWSGRNVTLVAKFAPRPMKVNCSVPGGGGEVVLVNTDSSKNEYYQAKPAPGYEFMGWEVDGNVIADRNPVDITFYPGRVVTLKAEFQKKVITMTATASEGGTILGDSSATHEYSESISASFTAKPNTDYQFEGWYVKGYKVGDSETITRAFIEDIDFVARFVKKGITPVDPDPDPGPGPAPDPGPGPDPIPKPPYPYKEFKITYHPGVYGAGSAVTDTAYPGIGWLRGTTFTRPGYIQAGWSWDPYGKEFNAALNAPMPMLYENITVYPYWEPIKGPLVLTVGYSGSGAIQVNGRYVYNGESFTIRPGESLTFGFYPASGNYVYSVLLAGRYREYPGYGFTVSYDMMQNRNQTLAVRFESVYTRPKTGDDSNIALWAALGICSAVCLGVLLIAKKKKK